MEHLPMPPCGHAHVRDVDVVFEALAPWDKFRLACLRSRSLSCSPYPLYDFPSSRLFGWLLGVVVSVVGRINEVNQHRARLVHDG